MYSCPPLCVTEEPFDFYGKKGCYILLSLAKHYRKKNPNLKDEKKKSDLQFSTRHFGKI